MPLRLREIQQVACNHHAAAIGPNGELYFWGTGVFGTFYEPKLIIESDIVDVSVGGCFGVAKDKTGLLWAWGKNSFGELCQQDKETRNQPHPIMQL
jgi:alpha-tubulin suppressor-like RCC1 family protein